MVQRCGATNCNSRYIKGQNLSFFKFPIKRPEQFQLWVAATGLTHLTPTSPLASLCQKHFEPKYLLFNASGKQVLSKEAVPTLFHPDQAPSQFNSSTDSSVAEQRLVSNGAMNLYNVSVAETCKNPPASPPKPKFKSVFNPQLSLLSQSNGKQPIKDSAEDPSLVPNPVEYPNPASLNCTRVAPDPLEASVVAPGAPSIAPALLGSIRAAPDPLESTSAAPDPLEPDTLGTPSIVTASQRSTSATTEPQRPITVVPVPLAASIPAIEHKIQNMVRQKCAALNCNSKYRKGQKLSFFKFPVTRPEQFNAWVEAAGLNHLNRALLKTLCQNHFEPRDVLVNASGKQVLAKGAIPTLFHPDQAPSQFNSSTGIPAVQQWYSMASNKMINLYNASLAESERANNSGQAKPVSPPQPKFKSVFNTKLSLHIAAPTRLPNIKPNKDALGSTSMAPDPLGSTSRALDPLEESLLVPDPLGAPSIAPDPLGYISVAPDPLESTNVVSDPLEGNSPSLASDLPVHFMKVPETFEPTLDYSIVKEEVDIPCDDEMETPPDCDEDVDDQLDEMDFQTLEHECQTCPESFNTPEELSEHNSEAHSFIAVAETDFKCDYCPKTFKDQDNLTAHVSSRHMGIKQFSCAKCGHRFCKKLNLEQHMKKAHQDDPTTFRCKSCPKMFRSLKFLETHVKAAHDKFSCWYCKGSLANKKSLQRHVQKFHPDLYANFVLTCAICKETFDTKAVLSLHVITCSKQDMNELRMACGLCQLKFKKRQNLLQHMKKEHSRVHNSVKDPKPFVCQVCSKGFGYESELETHSKANHKKISLLKRKVPCPKCPVVFDSSVGLKNHYKRVHEDVKFPCKTCAMVFNSRDKLFEHILTIHKN